MFFQTRDMRYAFSVTFGLRAGWCNFCSQKIARWAVSVSAWLLGVGQTLRVVLRRFTQYSPPMTDQTNRPTVTRTGLIAAAIAFTLPFIADRLIIAAMTEVKDASLGAVIGMAVYTALPFLLLDSAMRPRRRVRLALWMGLAFTVLVWAAFAQTGRSAQVDASAGNAHVGLYMLTMIWPALIIGVMGAAAKIGEPSLPENNHVA